MGSRFERFWEETSFAVVGNSAVKPFPILTYRALKERPGTTVYAVDPGRDEVDGDRAFNDLSDLPGPVSAVVLEPPREETAAWIDRVASAGIARVWIHMGRDTPEALALADEKGLEVCSGTCAVQYLTGGFPHNLHRALRKLVGRW
jgi:predicted CoA-binding protein